MKFLNYLAIAALAVSVAFMSCKKNGNNDDDDDDDDDIDIVVDVEVDVYVLGKRGNYVALWVNGDAQDINVTDGTILMEANSIFVSDDDVYMAGVELTQQYKVFATLWVNGIAQYLTDGTRNAGANSVFVSGDDVYVAGYGISELYVRTAKLWINGNEQNLSDENICSAEANSVFVLGNNVYVVGYGAYERTIATLWVNGVAQNLTDGTRDAEANSVYVVGNNVYVVGYEVSGQELTDDYGFTSYRRVAKLWINGVAQNLSDGTRDAEANSVFVAGGNVYVVGYEFNEQNKRVAKAWVNDNVSINITGGIEANSVFVADNYVYVAGYNDNRAMLWKNGELQNLTLDVYYDSMANSVFVVEKETK